MMTRWMLNEDVAKIFSSLSIGDGTCRRRPPLSKPASISGRYELKHLIQPDLARKIIDFLIPHVEMDEYCLKSDTGSYTVRSIYFDSPDFECFHEKLDGQRHREKFRIRTYNHPASAPLFLEHKRKNGISYMKRRLLLDKDTLEAVKAFGYESLKASTPSGKDGHTLEELLFRVHSRAYSPVTLITYDREAYVYPGDETTRVTFDRNLRASMFPDLDQICDEAGLEYVLYDWIVLEVKFNHVVPQWLRRLNTLFDLRRQACSKYCTCVGHFLGGMPTIKDGVAHVRTS